MPPPIPEPWLGFLREVDRKLSQPIEVHCLGGFVLAVRWGLPRPTGDVDFVEVEPSSAGDHLLAVAGDGSDLSDRHKLSFHRVTVAEYPEGYASRLTDVTPKSLARLRLLAFEVHDLALAKLARNSPRDRHDVSYLAANGHLDGKTLKQRFEAEQRPYLLNESRESATLALWLDEYFDRGEASR